jgi:hypothetical protein
MQTKMKKAKMHKRGSTLPLAMVMVVILLLIGIGLLQLGFGARINAIVGSGYISARAAADAGIAQALHVMNSDINKDWTGYSDSDDFSDSAYGNAAYNYSIEGNSPPYQYDIVSTGTTARGTKTVHAAVRRVSKWEYAIIVEETIDLKANSIVDGYNSADPTDPATYVKIGTNSILPGMIDLKNGVVVDGDVLVGFGGDVATVILDRGATTGPRYPLPQPVPLTRNLAPAGLPPGQPLVPDANGVITTTQSGVYPFITLNQGEVLRVGDGINQVVDVVLYIQGDLTLKERAELRVTGIPGQEHASTWSSLTIYLDGQLTCHESSALNNETFKPGQFNLIGTGPDGINWEIKNAGDFYGVFDAPNAHIDIKQSGDIYGAVIGKSFLQRESCNIYYDQDLRDPSLWPTGFGIARWWEE